EDEILATFDERTHLIFALLDHLPATRQRAADNCDLLHSHRVSVARTARSDRRVRSGPALSVSLQVRNHFRSGEQERAGDHDRERFAAMKRSRRIAFKPLIKLGAVKHYDRS